MTIREVHLLAQRYNDFVSRTVRRMIMVSVLLSLDLVFIIELYVVGVSSSWLILEQTYSIHRSY